MRIDGVRAEDVSLGAVAVFVAVAIMAYFVFIEGWQTAAAGDGASYVGSVLIAGVVLFLGVMFAYESAKPEVDTECDACGAPIRVNSGADRRDGVLVARRTKPPRRMHLGPLSLVVNRNRHEWQYCSVGCVERDAPQECIEHVGVADPPRDEPLDALLDPDDAASEEVADD